MTQVQKDAFNAGYQHGYFAPTHFIDTRNMAEERYYLAGFDAGRQGYSQSNSDYFRDHGLPEGTLPR
jgi:hypothetical protein